MSSSPPAGLPGSATVDTDRGSVSLVFDEGMYSVDAAYGASYVFIDRCYVLLDRPEAERIRVTLTLKDPGTASEPLLMAHAGEFANELLSCAWRERINEQNRGAIEEITMRAIAGAAGPPTLDDLEQLDFTDEPFDDPLGIAMSWEDKYAKDKKARDDTGEESS